MIDACSVVLPMMAPTLAGPPRRTKMSETVGMAQSYTRRIGGAQYTTYSKIVHVDTMSDQHERLKGARIKAGFASAAEAARAMDIPEARYSHHENGTRKFKYDTAERYAEWFKTTADWLMGGKQKGAVEGGPRQARDVTKLSWVSAGRLGPVAPVESVAVQGKLRVENLPAGEWFAIEVRGRSMERLAPEGSTIIVNRRDQTLVSAKFYVLTAADGEATFKRYRSSPDRFTPYTLDPDEEPLYPDLEADRDWQVFGRVHQVIIDV